MKTLQVIALVSSLLLMLPFSFAQTLENYPEIFTPGNVDVDVLIAVGDKAPASHVIAQTQLALSLGDFTGKPAIGIATLASDITSPPSENLILIGNACDNVVTAWALENPEPCDDGLERGTAHVQLINYENGKRHLLAYGLTDKATTAAVDALRNHDISQLSGMELEIPVANDDEELREREELKQIIEDTPQPTLFEEPEPELIMEEDDNDIEEEGEDEEELELPGQGPKPIVTDDTNLVKRFWNWLTNLFR